MIVANQIDVNLSFGFENVYELKQEFPQIKAMSKEILECGRGERTLKELFIEGEDQNLLDSGE